MEDRNIIESIREERKQGVADGTIPEWMTSNGYLLFKQKYVLEGETVESTFRRIANAAAGHAPDSPTARDAFFDLMWKGWLALSTPVLANMGTERGCPVSCSGGYVNDSIYGFYDARLEVAMLTKNGFGTSSYLGAIRGRGEPISVGGVASGVMPVLKGFVQDSSDVSQANTRRGAWAGYLDIDHKDFFEAADYLLNHPDDLNIGWVVSKAFIARLDAGDPDAVLRWQKMMKVRCVTGKGYIFKVDHVNDQNPAMYKELGLKVSASNLCVTGNTIIDTDKGRVAISQLEPDEHYLVKSHNLESGEVEYAPITAGGVTGMADELIVIELDDGHQLSLTEDHLVYTSNRGYVRAGDLDENDDLVIDK